MFAEKSFIYLTMSFNEYYVIIRCLEFNKMVDNEDRRVET